MIPVTVREAPQGSTWGAEVLQLPDGSQSEVNCWIPEYPSPEVAAT